MGVKFVGDLFIGRNQLHTWNSFRSHYRIRCNYLDFETLVASLPSCIRQGTQDNVWYQQPCFPARLQFLFDGNRSLRTILTRSCVRSNRHQTADVDRIENKWIRDVQLFCSSSVWDVKKMCRATRYVAFQYKLIMRILTTNTFL